MSTMRGNIVHRIAVVSADYMYERSAPSMYDARNLCVHLTAPDDPGSHPSVKPLYMNPYSTFLDGMGVMAHR